MLYVLLDWGSVVAALIAAVPGTIAAIAGIKNHRSLKTPSGTSVGKQVESTHQTSIANNYRLQAMGSKFDVPMPDKASEAESKVEALNDVMTRAEREQNG